MCHCGQEPSFEVSCRYLPFFTMLLTDRQCRIVQSYLFPLRFRHWSADWRNSVLRTVCLCVLASDGLAHGLW